MSLYRNLFVSFVVIWMMPHFELSKCFHQTCEEVWLPPPYMAKTRQTCPHVRQAGDWGPATLPADHAPMVRKRRSAQPSRRPQHPLPLEAIWSWSPESKGKDGISWIHLSRTASPSTSQMNLYRVVFWWSQRSDKKPLEKRHECNHQYWLNVRMQTTWFTMLFRLHEQNWHWGLFQKRHGHNDDWVLRKSVWMCSLLCYKRGNIIGPVRKTHSCVFGGKQLRATPKNTVGKF